MACLNCLGEGLVCENHMDRAWNENLLNGCECGAGAPCPVCDRYRASLGFSEPWRQLALRGLELVEDAVKDTAWGHPTIGPDYGEELRAEYGALLATQAMEAGTAETTGSVHDSAVGNADAPNEGTTLQEEQS